MNMRTGIACVILLATIADFSSAAAQGIMPDVGDLPSASRAEQIMLYQQLMREIEVRKAAACEEYGCLAIINDNTDYDIVEFRAELPAGSDARSDVDGWSSNFFASPLRPHKALLVVRNLEATPCRRPIRVVLRHRQTRERATYDGSAALCSAPGTGSLLRIRYVEPRVTIEPENGDE